jgi:predicted nucleic acid-binding protein
VILLDTSGLVANYDRRDRHHAAVTRILATPQRRILSPFVLAELDYLVGRIAGQVEVPRGSPLPAAQLVVLEDVARGAYQLEAFGAADIAAARTIIERHADLQVGLTEASLVVLAERYGCHDLLTLGERHFRAIPGPNGSPFRLLPADLG